MFDDLDDLLEDVPMNKNPQKSKAAPVLTSSKSTMQKKRDDDDDFDWGDKPSGS